MDRLVFAELYRLAPTVLNANALPIVKPETVIQWRRAGFRSYWRWKSRRRGGRPTAPPEIRRDEHRQSAVGCAADPRRVAQARNRCRADQRGQIYNQRREPPSQGWKTFLHNHADGIAEMDLFVVPTISFRLLYGLLIIGHGRRQILWFAPLGSCDKSPVL
jgi:hypothetical protein